MLVGNNYNSQVRFQGWFNKGAEKGANAVKQGAGKTAQQMRNDATAAFERGDIDSDALRAAYREADNVAEQEQ